MVENLPQKNGCHPPPNLRQMPIGIHLTREGWACYTYSVTGRRKRKAVQFRREPVAVFGRCKPCIRRGYRLPLHFCGKAASSYAHQPKDFAPKCTTPADRRSGFAVVVPPVRKIFYFNSERKTKDDKNETPSYASPCFRSADRGYGTVHCL